MAFLDFMAYESAKIKFRFGGKQSQPLFFMDQYFGTAFFPLIYFHHTLLMD